MATLKNQVFQLQGEILRLQEKIKKSQDLDTAMREKIETLEKIIEDTKEANPLLKINENLVSIIEGLRDSLADDMKTMSAGKFLELQDLFAEFDKLNVES
jgi:predicted  nucleic acid-binding Zn-ribbon protein